MRKLLINVTTAIVLALAGIAHANLITATHTITASGPGTLGFTHFNLAADDQVTLRTEGPTIDAVLYLLRDDGVLTADDFITFDDDSCPMAVCGPSGGFGNAFIQTNLTAGNYIAVVGDFAVTLVDVINGINMSNTAFGIMTGVVNTLIESEATLTLVAEPNSVALLGIGAMLLCLILRRKRR